MAENDCEIKNEFIRIQKNKFGYQITFFIKDGVVLERLGLHKERKLSIKDQLYMLFNEGIITPAEYLKYIENLGKVLSAQKVWSIDYIYEPKSFMEKVNYKLALSGWNSFCFRLNCCGFMSGPDYK